MSCDVGTPTPVFWDSQPVRSGPGNLCHRCIFQNSTLSFLSHYGEQPWDAAAKMHIAENVLYATVRNTGWMFHWNEDPAL